jgi:hypothetical protein
VTVAAPNWQVIFVAHVGTLTALVITCVVFVIKHSGGEMSANWAAPLPDIVNLEGTASVYSGTVARALIFGGCAFMLM